MKYRIGLLSLGILALLGAGCEVTTANLQNVKMCSALVDYQCAEDTVEFSSDTPELFLTALLQNAVEGTVVNYSWYYLGEQGTEEPYEIDSVDFTKKEGDQQEVYGSLSIPDNGWPVGAYQVVLQIKADNVDPITKEFSIK
ncbi:MAG TPA: hypothetical protein DCS29_00660 [Candidatus Magasanikbacteria bacterium]|nr:hypothetical protein [Candidatus Magasanikbacteria bacterium]